jgi:hypothetical protein
MSKAASGLVTSMATAFVKPTFSHEPTRRGLQAPGLIDTTPSNDGRFLAFPLESAHLTRGFVLR